MPLQAISLRANHAQYYQAIPRHDCGGSLGEVVLWHNSSTSGILKRVMQVVSKSNKYLYPRWHGEKSLGKGKLQESMIIMDLDDLKVITFIRISSGHQSFVLVQ